MNLLALITVIAWSHPTTYVNDDPLPLEEISHTTISWVREGTSGPVQTVNVFAPASSTQLTIQPGRWCFSLKTVTVQNNESDNTEPVCHKVTGKPNSPTTIVITFGF